MHIAAKKGNIEVIKTLLDMKFPLYSVKNNGVTALGVAAHSGNLRALDILHKAGANINFLSHQGISPLYLAIKTNKIECVKFLVQNKASIHIDD